MEQRDTEPCSGPTSDGLVGPSGGQVACAGCGAALDPFRAGHAAIFNTRVHFFCDAGRCRSAFLTRAAEEVLPDAGMDAMSSRVRGAEPMPEPRPVAPERLPTDDQPDWIEPLAAPARPVGPGGMPPAERRDLDTVLAALTLVAGALTMALELAEPTRPLLAARVVLAGVGSSALVGRAVTTRSDPAEPHRLMTSSGALLAAIVAGWALFGAGPVAASRACFLAGAVVTAAAASIWLLALARAPVTAARRWVEQHLDPSDHPVVGATSNDGAPEKRPGEPITIHAGERVSVDVQVTGGEAEVVPWPEAPIQVRRTAGELLVAGARVVSGQLHGSCVSTGMDRAFARALLSPMRRCDVHARLARLSRLVAERASILVAVTCALVVVAMSWGRGSALDAAMVMVAVHAAIGTTAVGGLVGLTIARGIHRALLRGIVYDDAEAWDCASRANAAVLCARGTLLRGEPELVEMEVASTQHTVDDLLAMAAGVLSAERHPVALSLGRAAQRRQLRPHRLRNPREFPALGMAAVSSSGEPVLVGGRTLMLEHHVPVAAIERRVSELEARGRNVLLVATGGRLVGLLAFQDGLRTGARAAIQVLLDAGIEPILVSSDSRETCEALGRSLDIEHIRPEVPDGERHATVSRLKDAGAVVAVIGRPGLADDALAAADVPVAMAAAGRAPEGRHGVALASDDVRDAAAALAHARQTQAQATQILALMLVPALFGSAVAAAGALPAEYAPLAALLGVAAAVAHLRALDRTPPVRPARPRVDGSERLG